MHSTEACFEDEKCYTRRRPVIDRCIGIFGNLVICLYCRIIGPVERKLTDIQMVAIAVIMSRMSIAILTVTSPIVINVPTRGLLAVKTKDSFVLWLAKFKYQKTCL